MFSCTGNYESKIYCFNKHVKMNSFYFNGWGKCGVWGSIIKPCVGLGISKVAGWNLDGREKAIVSYRKIGHQWI